jgi:prepilin-type N-terminal cleavage/methylation domain-containing protein
MSMKRPCPGFTLIEVMVSLVMLGVVSALGVRLLLRQHWSATAQGERGALQASLRGGTLFLLSELRELGGSPGDPDIQAFAAESLTYRSMRGAGVSCARGPGTVSVDAAGFFGYRIPQAGRDSLLLFHEGREESATDDRWLHLPILSVSNGICVGAPAIVFRTVLDTTSYPLATFGQLAPIRTYEVMQIKLYSSSGDYWLGGRSVSGGETIQPIIGPLTSRGLGLAYLDSTGASAMSRDRVRSVEFTLRGLTADPIRTGAGEGAAQRRADSLVTRVLLRNW